MPHVKKMGHIYNFKSTKKSYRALDCLPQENGPFKALISVVLITQKTRKQLEKTCASNQL